MMETNTELYNADFYAWGLAWGFDLHISLLHAAILLFFIL
jgi:hypothetical protein